MIEARLMLFSANKSVFVPAIQTPTTPSIRQEWLFPLRQIFTLTMKRREVRDVLQILLMVLIFVTDRIGDFLSKFKGSQEKDFTLDFANIDLRDRNDPEQDESTSLKYMQQLVRVMTRSEGRKTRLIVTSATDRESRTTNAYH
jgi:hypothetical protein